MLAKASYFLSNYQRYEQHFLEISHHVCIDDNQLNVYSDELADLIVNTVSSVESCSKYLHEYLFKQQQESSSIEAKNIRPFKPDESFEKQALSVLEQEWQLSKKQVIISAESIHLSEKYRTITPFNFLDTSYEDTKDIKGTNNIEGTNDISASISNSLPKDILSDIHLSIHMIINIYVMTYYVITDICDLNIETSYGEQLKFPEQLHVILKNICSLKESTIPLIKHIDDYITTNSSSIYNDNTSKQFLYLWENVNFYLNIKETSLRLLKQDKNISYYLTNTSDVKPVDSLSIISSINELVLSEDILEYGSFIKLLEYIVKLQQEPNRSIWIKSYQAIKHNRLGSLEIQEGTLSSIQQILNFDSVSQKFLHEIIPMCELIDTTFQSINQSITQMQQALKNIKDKLNKPSQKSADIINKTKDQIVTFENKFNECHDLEKSLLDSVDYIYTVKSSLHNEYKPTIQAALESLAALFILCQYLKYLPQETSIKGEYNAPFVCSYKNFSTEIHSNLFRVKPYLAIFANIDNQLSNHCLQHNKDICKSLFIVKDYELFLEIILHQNILDKHYQLPNRGDAGAVNLEKLSLIDEEGNSDYRCNVVRLYRYDFKAYLYNWKCDNIDTQKSLNSDPYVVLNIYGKDADIYNYNKLNKENSDNSEKNKCLINEDSSSVYHYVTVDKG